MENISNVFEFVHTNYRKKAITTCRRIAINYLVASGLLVLLNIYGYDFMRDDLFITETGIAVLKIFNAIVFMLIISIGASYIKNPTIDLPKDVSKKFIMHLRNNVPAPIYANNGIHEIAVYTFRRSADKILLYNSEQSLLCTITTESIVVNTKDGEKTYII